MARASSQLVQPTPCQITPDQYAGARSPVPSRPVPRRTRTPTTSAARRTEHHFGFEYRRSPERGQCRHRGEGRSRFCSAQRPGWLPRQARPAPTSLTPRRPVTPRRTANGGAPTVTFSAQTSRRRRRDRKRGPGGAADEPRCARSFRHVPRPPPATTTPRSCRRRSCRPPSPSPLLPRSRRRRR